ncbi:3-dehydroquinate synthase [Companilactobacillus jidongensis]|uniref:3-dehydroquinate synthase n=1 Tax=Companilactobacillus jidongensis TaxID=2486006 RepID=UPI000F794C00|nr:3-dehydroquinate synthase [Companilactobacillus jidongensis]
MITVTLPTKTYNIEIKSGLHQEIGNLVKSIWKAKKIVLITDKQVAKYYLDKTVSQLETAGFEILTEVVPAGEQSKSLVTVSKIISEMATEGFTRKDGVVALGGGVVGDLSGLVSSLYMRGIPFVQIATSLTAMVDSSVGGKTAVNLGEVKNIIGTFHQPDLVIIDPEFLKTLSQRNLVEGYGEVVKCSALKGGEFFELTGKIRDPVGILDNATELIKRSINLKANIVMKDEKEQNLRRVLNFGHTFGHAIELLAHGELKHGEAVAIGMVRISQCFENIGLTKKGVTREITDRLLAVGLPIDSDLIGTNEFFEHLKNDKKNDGKQLNLVALSEIGLPIIVPKSLESIPEFLNN